MIPALLSCLFVLYLYRTLNAPESDAADSTDAADGAVSGHSELSEQLSGLQSRIDAIASELSGRASK
ncbi:hypothetical protein SAMN06265222_101811 [Neorhodopirellula lusitana]|uniref:Phage shock protein B n=1 Tax=Neorhodopirellula lusitana TaxID=445327 RepID=A0ABY1PRL2_9BACT|nr:hypothetical protein [Neorhodopirellula lusitana]SMP42614.1 hypothetical protein SAMN06265222_101811 [Neorhodopirellula lusitana]